MRISCNGCRVLRKGCSENCSIRPCLQWIRNPESQANATVFLAKFYGRAGLLNLINVGPEHVRPAIFRSLLYEACGRIVNPIYGSVGLLCSGSWQLCQSAVESVLRGSPVVPISSETASSWPAPPIKVYDVRHAIKKAGVRAAAAELHKFGKGRTRFKRTGGGAGFPEAKTSPEISGQQWCFNSTVDWQRAPSHESAGSHSADAVFSMETMEASQVSQGETSYSEAEVVGLELSLRLPSPSPRSAPAA
ncbi:LOB domain-containing protein 41 [Apostasia shenzhenica]|uniref:LOB domain-containing protein 41 n=1 Tax=Apostasia shenzhenica TaxID=1088818 RepID=A0A2I0BBY2_9ASPA|nr:LOB domain-containing protein 41 [Apostasia shenzhenica]